MKALIYKDFIFHKRDLICAFVWFLCCIFGNLVLLSYGMQMDMLQHLAFGFVSISLVACAYNDEISKWTQFSANMPFSRTQIVSSKYLLALIIILIATVIKMVFDKLSLIAVDSLISANSLTGGYLTVKGLFVINVYEQAELVLYIITLLISPAIGLLLVFVNANTAKSGFLFSALWLILGYKIFDRFSLDFTILYLKYPAVRVIAMLIGVMIFALSWSISVYCFKKRDF